MPGFIEIKLPKGCILVLTPEEYDRGIARGKAKRRAQILAKRIADRKEQDGAQESPMETDDTGGA